MGVLQVNNIKKRFFRKRSLLKKQEVWALKGVSFDVRKEIFGFIGPNGAGKTTTIKIILNFIRPDSGKVSILGKSNREISVKKHIGFLPERPYIYNSITGKEYLDFCADVYGIPYYERKKVFLTLLELVDLIGVEEQPISSYSKGMVQRLLFAATLINDPELLILDEPMSGLDPVGRNIIASAMKDLKRRGKAVFYSSHIIQDVERLSDRVAIIVDGEIKLLDTITNIVQKFLKGYVLTVRKVGSNNIEVFKTTPGDFWPFLEKLRSEGYEIISIEPERLSLEEILVSYIQKKRRAD